MEKTTNLFDFNFSNVSTAEGLYLGFTHYIKDDELVVIHSVVHGTFDNDLQCFTKCDVRKVTVKSPKDSPLKHFSFMDKVRFDIETKQFQDKTTITCSNIRKS